MFLCKEAVVIFIVLFSFNFVESNAKGKGKKLKYGSIENEVLGKLPYKAEPFFVIRTNDLKRNFENREILFEEVISPNEGIFIYY